MNIPRDNTALRELTDAELIGLIAEQRSRSALRELYDRYRHPLGRFLRSKIKQDSVVDEIYNDVMLVVWNKAGDFRGDAKTSSWIFGIAYRLAMSAIRGAQRQPDSTSEYDLDAMTDNTTVDTESPVVEQLKSAIEELSEDHRLVIQLAYFYGHSVAEISELVQSPINTIKTRLFHARQKLKIQMAATSSRNTALSGRG